MSFFEYYEKQKSEVPWSVSDKFSMGMFPANLLNPIFKQATVIEMLSNVRSRSSGIGVLVVDPTP